MVDVEVVTVVVVVNITTESGDTGMGVVVVIVSTGILTVVKFGTAGGRLGVAGTNG